MLNFSSVPRFRITLVHRCLFFLFGLVLGIGETSAQGCSDAGFCSIGSLDHQVSGSKQSPKSYFRMSLPVGLGDDDVFVFSPGVEYVHIHHRWQLQGKLTGNYASGNLGSAFGAGDVFLSATYSLPEQKGWVASFTGGTKLPLNQGNLKENGLSLPMQYQSSLGTIDLILGFSLQSDRWKWAAGWQQPLSGRNRNNFLPVYWTDQRAGVYPPTNNFNRKGDVLVRSTYAIIKKKSIQVEGGLLGIYHLGKDTYVNFNERPNPIPIEGSQGLTLNATVAAEWKINPKFSFGFTGGVPLVVREVRPDGLTRSIVFSPQITYHF
jgi:hypothetical protein